ncbi:MAG: tyrosine-type recombinase/integrase [Solirubrobacteraceae bacterium]
MASKRVRERPGDGVYAYETRAGTRYYFKYRKSDGRSATRRGFESPRAARRERERTVVSAARGEQLSTTETFGEFFDSWLRARRPYLEPGTYTDYEIHGRIRLTELRPIKLTRLSTATIEAWLAELVEQERYAPKTINNALTTLVACLNDAVRKGRMARNPAAAVRRLPAGHIERDYLRLPEIPVYLNACLPPYRPLAEVLVATGLRISEALALTWLDVDFDNSAIRVLRSGKPAGDGSTKGDRFRAVDFGPRLSGILLRLRAEQADRGGDGSKGPVFPGPGRWSTTEAAARMDRNTVSRSWHKRALKSAELRDMTLHSLRHTAAAAWLTTGRPLIYVQRQLGHASITTTERLYGHLETTFLRTAALETESAIWGERSGASSAGRPT